MESTENKKDSILVIGKPKTAKTTYLTQLFGRIQDRKGTNELEFAKFPENSEYLMRNWKELNKGQNVDSTSSLIHQNLLFNLRKEDNFFDLDCPDYGGEQVSSIIRTKKVDQNWISQIENSTIWLLMIRLSLIEVIEDLSTKEISNDNGSTQESSLALKPSGQVELVSLLQTLVFLKGVSAQSQVTFPKIAVVFTCWDEIGEKSIPSELLSERLPFLNEFIRSRWVNDSISVWGVSPLESNLSDQGAIDHIQKEGAEDVGYVVNPDGQQSLDLSLIISELVTSL